MSYTAGLIVLFERAEDDSQVPSRGVRFGNDEWIMHSPATDCPACGYPDYCDCSTCFRHIPAGMFPGYHPTGDTWSCGNCGHVESLCEREDRSMRYAWAQEQEAQP